MRNGGGDGAVPDAEVKDHLVSEVIRLRTIVAERSIDYRGRFDRVDKALDEGRARFQRIEDRVNDVAGDVKLIALKLAHRDGHDAGQEAVLRPQRKWLWATLSALVAAVLATVITTWLVGQ